MENEDVLASGGLSPAPSGETVRPGRRFSAGEAVEVMFDIDASWNPARVVGVWAEAEIPSGKRSVSYDIEGKDEDGPFWGRFTADHVRAAVLVGRSEPHAQTESRPEAKP